MTIRASRPRLVSRLLRHWRAHGTADTVRTVVERSRPSLYLRETHVWYELRLGSASTPRRPLPAGYRLSPGDTAQLPLLEQLASVNPEDGARRLSEGGGFWMMLDGHGDAAFSCWVYRGTAPVLAADGGRLTLPEEFAVLEDSVTAASSRGQGLAPAAWSQVAMSLLEEGRTSLLTKVEVANIASRRAVTKAGFVPFATVHYRRLLWRVKVTTEPTEPGSGTARWLATSLRRDPAERRRAKAM